MSQHANEATLDAVLSHVDYGQASRQGYAVAAKLAEDEGMSKDEVTIVARAASIATSRAVTTAVKAVLGGGHAGGATNFKRARESKGQRSSSLNPSKRSKSSSSRTRGTGAGASAADSPASAFHVYREVDDSEASTAPQFPMTSANGTGSIVKYRATNDDDLTDAPLVPGFWLGPRRTPPAHTLQSVDPELRMATCARSVHSGFMEASLLVRYAFSRLHCRHALSSHSTVTPPPTTPNAHTIRLTAPSLIS
jgi:hypothetical protein